jgi:hypothetical protein
MMNRSFSISLILLAVTVSRCTNPENKQPREEQLCFLKVTQGELTITEDENMEMLIDSMVMNIHIKNDSVTGIFHWLPARKDRMTGSLAGTIHDDIITAIYSYTAEGIDTKEEKILKLDSNRIFFKTGELVEHNGIWILKDKAAPFSESIPKTLCQ